MKVQRTNFHTSIRPYDILDNDGVLIARIDDEQLARQFAASDDLLAACKMWIAADELMNELDPTAYNDACIEAHRATRAAIAKASK